MPDKADAEHDHERRATDIGGRLAAIEAREVNRDRMLTEIHGEVMGGAGGKVGMGETQRRQDERIVRLERIVLWGGTLYTGVLSVVMGAWAIHLVGPPGNPTVIYVQPTPGIHALR